MNAHTSLTQLVRRTLLSVGFHRDAAQMPAGVGIVVGVSGGPDSMALLSVLSRLRAELHFELAALTVDHGLRPEAQLECQSVVAFCQQLGVDCFTERLTFDSRENLQARARELRYQLLFARAREQFEAPLVATAHHRRDKAETVLLRLLRGTSLNGLAVLPARSSHPPEPDLLRPLITASLDQIHTYLQRHQIPFALDPSNQDPHYQRVRVRHELLPLLRELAPQIEESLISLSEEAAELESPLLLTREQRRQLRRALREPQLKIDLPLSAGLRLKRQ